MTKMDSIFSFFQMIIRKWTGWDLNPWPPACKAGDLPLIYRPITKINIESIDEADRHIMICS
jgi:hypothetical protein